jgi:VanZ family protein
MDETIQIFSNRGSSVRDVWIDVFGYVAGAVIVAAICLLIAYFNKKKTENK